MQSSQLGDLASPSVLSVLGVYEVHGNVDEQLPSVGNETREDGATNHK